MKQIRNLPAAPLSTDNQNVFNNKAFSFVDALDDFVLDTNEVAAEINSLSQNVSSNASSAADSKTQAQNFSVSAKQSSDQAASYLTSFINSPSTQATSTSGISIGIGTKNLTITQTGKNFVPGQFVQIVNSADKWMLGAITSFNASTGAMVVNVAKSKGNGETFYAWTITLSNPTPLEDCVVAMATGFDYGVPTVFGSNFKNVSGITFLSTGKYIVNLKEPCTLNTVFLANFTTATSPPDLTARGGNVQIAFYGGYSAIQMSFFSGAGNLFTPGNVLLMAFSF
jgi:hypothetical protein